MESDQVDEIATLREENERLRNRLECTYPHYDTCTSMNNPRIIISRRDLEARARKVFRECCKEHEINPQTDPSHSWVREAIEKIKQSILYTDPETISEYMIIWNDKIDEGGRVVRRGEHELAACEYEVAMELRPDWQPAAQEFFEAVTLLYRDKHSEIP